MLIVVVVRYSLFHWEGARDENIPAIRKCCIASRCLYMDLNHRKWVQRGVQFGLGPQAEPEPAAFFPRIADTDSPTTSCTHSPRPGSGISLHTDILFVHEMETRNAKSLPGTWSRHDAPSRCQTIRSQIEVRAPVVRPRNVFYLFKTADTGKPTHEFVLFIFSFLIVLVDGAVE